MSLNKKPAYYENGGHIDYRQVALWNFHDEYIKWMVECQMIEAEQVLFKDHTDSGTLELTEIVYPPEPVRPTFDDEEKICL